MGWTSKDGRLVLYPSVQGSTGLDSTGRDWDLHVPRLCMWPSSRRYVPGLLTLVADSQARSFHGSFRSAPQSWARELPPCELARAHTAVAVAQWKPCFSKWSQGGLPMFIPTLPSRCIILKSCSRTRFRTSFRSKRSIRPHERGHPRPKQITSIGRILSMTRCIAYNVSFLGPVAGREKKRKRDNRRTTLYWSAPRAQLDRRSSVLALQANMLNTRYTW